MQNRHGRSRTATGPCVRSAALFALLFGLATVGCSEGVFDDASDGASAEVSAGPDAVTAKPYTPTQYTDWRSRFDKN